LLVMSVGKALKRLPRPLSGYTRKGHFAVSWSRYLDK